MGLGTKILEKVESTVGMDLNGDGRIGEKKEGHHGHHGGDGHEGHHGGHGHHGGKGHHGHHGGKGGK